MECRFVSKSYKDIRKIPQREFQFNFYSKYAFFLNNKIVFEDVPASCVLFETRSVEHPINKPYISQSFSVQTMVDEWYYFFPLKNSQPNCYLNGFDFRGQRRLLTMTLFNPELSCNNLGFDYVLDIVEGDLDVDDVISEWDGKGALSNVSILVDGFPLSAAKDIGEEGGGAASKAAAKAGEEGKLTKILIATTLGTALLQTASGYGQTYYGQYLQNQEQEEQNKIQAQQQSQQEQSQLAAQKQSEAAQAGLADLNACLNGVNTLATNYAAGITSVPAGINMSIGAYQNQIVQEKTKEYTADCNKQYGSAASGQ